MPLDPPHANDLRSLVRQVLREALAQRQPGHSIETVAIASDADLASFVRLLIQRLDDPGTGPAVRSGRHHFALERPLPGPGEEGTHLAIQRGPALSRERERMVEGVVTEHRIEKLAGAGTIFLAPSAILTPLARDRARRLGLKIERSR